MSAHDPFNENDLDVYEFLQPGLVKSKNTNFGKIYIGLESGDVRFLQRWRYRFRRATGQPEWTHQEKMDLHYRFKSEIWTFWNSRRPLATPSDPASRELVQLLNAHNGVLFNVSGNSAFARRFASQGVPITFEVLRAIERPHWRINIAPLPRGTVTNVDWSNNVISFDPKDIEPSRACNNAPRAQQVCVDDFQTMPHEFGHTLMVEDEYTRGSPHLRDTNSILNIGNQVRPRHLTVILRHLNTMLPNTRSLPPN